MKNHHVPRSRRWRRRMIQRRLAYYARQNVVTAQQSIRITRRTIGNLTEAIAKTPKHVLLGQAAGGGKPSSQPTVLLAQLKRDLRAYVGERRYYARRVHALRVRVG